MGLYRKIRRKLHPEPPQSGSAGTAASVVPSAQEQQQTVVRAEIVTYRETDLPRQVQTNANSLVCSLM